MPGVVDTSHTFATNDVVTSTLLNNIIDQTLFTSDALSNGTLALTSGKMKVATSGITSNELAANAVTTSAIASSTSASSGVTYAKMQYAANMKALGNVSGSLGVVSEVSILDEDDMVSDSATSLATQQSIKAYTDTKVATAVAASFVRGTAVATTSGTSVDFTSIPSTVKRITVILDRVSTNGSNNLYIQIGDTDGIETTGYDSDVSTRGGDTAVTTGFILTRSSSSSSICNGIITICNCNGNTWISSGNVVESSTVNSSTGSKSLSATLDRIRLNGGGDTFDAGQVNIMYE